VRGIEIAVATELSSGAISSILESVPGIAHVLRSPVADAMVNLSRAAAGLGSFRLQDAHELIRYAVRRGLIGSDEGDRVTAEIDGAAQAKAAKAATRKAAREERQRVARRAEKARARASSKRAPAKKGGASAKTGRRSAAAKRAGGRAKATSHGKRRR
jgi:hypothetical protein